MTKEKGKCHRFERLTLPGRVTLAELAERMGMTRQGVWHMRKRGWIPHGIQHFDQELNPITWSEEEANEIVRKYGKRK